MNLNIRQGFVGDIDIAELTYGSLKENNPVDVKLGKGGNTRVI